MQYANKIYTISQHKSGKIILQLYRYINNVKRMHNMFSYIQSQTLLHCCYLRQIVKLYHYYPLMIVPSTYSAWLYVRNAYRSR